MRKAIFLASLSVMMASVWGMNNVVDSGNSSNGVHQTVVTKGKAMIQDAIQNGDIDFCKRLLHVYNLSTNLNKFISESTPDDIVRELNSLEGSISDEWKKEAIALLKEKYNVPGKADEIPEDVLVQGLLSMRDDRRAISAIRHAFESKDLFLCLTDIISNLQDNNAILQMLLLGNNKTRTNNDQLANLLNSNDVEKFFKYITDEEKDPLFAACESGKQNIVKYLIECGADVNKKDGSSQTPLHIACKKDNESLVKYLIDHGADINKEDHFGRTPLFYVCKSGNKSLVKYLVEHGADINKESKKGEIPFFDACRSGNLDLVKYLVEEHGADINKEDKDKNTPLFAACESGNLDLVKYLIEHGADINKESKDGEIPLFDACRSGDEALVKYLVEKHEADINKENKNGDTPLFAACGSGNLNLVKYLMEEQGANINADINEWNRLGFLPLFNACKSGNLNLVKYLVEERGADINKKLRFYDVTALSFACGSGNLNLVEYLVEKGLDVNEANKYGETPLFAACGSGNLNLVKYLVEKHEADINKVNKLAGITPFFDACESGNLNLVKYLVEHGAVVNRKNKFGRTPLDMARDWKKAGSSPLNRARDGEYGNIVKYLEERLAAAGIESGGQFSGNSDDR